MNTELKARVKGSAFGVTVEIFIPDEVLDKCNVYREAFKKQKETVVKTPVFHVDYTKGEES